MVDVGIVGGSIAGCAMAQGLLRAGCSVEVFERSTARMGDRGSGVACPEELILRFAEAGYLDANIPRLAGVERLWLAADPDDTFGRVVWQQPSLAVSCNWGVLWRQLRAAVPDEHYHQGRAVAQVVNGTDEAVILFEDGSRHQCDVVVGADGYRSVVRSAAFPDVHPEYTDYAAFRGHLAEGLLSDERLLDALANGSVTAGFDGGHAIFYLIPDIEGRTEPGSRQLNWIVYARPAAVSGSDQVVPSIPEGGLPQQLSAQFLDFVDERLPKLWSGIIRITDHEDLSVYRVCDLSSPRYIAGRVLLCGDAASMARPHAVHGAGKAIGDALAAEDAFCRYRSWRTALDAYDQARAEFGHNLVDLAVRLGRTHVEQTPPWAEMTPSTMDSWARAALAGRSHYMYGNVGTAR